MRRNHLVSLLVFLILLIACGGPEAPKPEPDDVKISITPEKTELGPGGTKEFTAKVTGTTNVAVSWKADMGTIAGTGTTVTYTAPNVAGDYTVTATSQADSSQSASAVVTVIVPPPPKPTDTPNNSAKLSGAAIGDGSANTEQLRKELALNLVATNADFSLGKAYAVAESLGSKDEALYWVIPVKNISKQFHCFINLSTIRYKDAKGALLAEDRATFVVGSVGEEDGFFQDNCLKPDEQGYFVGTDTNAVHNKVSSLEVESVATDTFGLLPAETKVIPQSYEVEAAGGKSQIITVAVKNEGPDTVDLSGGATTILLDEDGAPLYWETSSEAEEQEGALAVGETGQLSTELEYEGRSAALYVSVLFGAATSSLRAETSDHVIKELMWNQRNARLSAALERSQKRLEMQ